MKTRSCKLLATIPKVLDSRASGGPKRVSGMKVEILCFLRFSTVVLPGSLRRPWLFDIDPTKRLSGLAENPIA